MSEVVVENEVEEQEGKVDLENERITFPDKNYFAEFRFILNKGEHEMWTPWLVYPCGYQKKDISFRKPSEKSKKIYAKDLMDENIFRFYDDIDDLIEEIEEEYGEDNVCTYILPGEESLNLQLDVSEIKRKMGIRSFQKVPTVLLNDSIQIRLCNNNLNNPKNNIIDFFNDFVANGAHEEEEVEESNLDKVLDEDDNLDLLE